MANLDEWGTVFGEAFRKGVGPGEIIDGDEDKINFTVKSYVTGKYVNATLWANSHGHIEVRQGDPVLINGKIKKKPKEQGDGFWVNLSISKIAVIPMDSGVDTRTSNGENAEGDDEPDVL